VGAICVANFAATIWLSLYLFVSHYRSDSVGAGPGLIWADLKSGRNFGVISIVLGHQTSRENYDFEVFHRMDIEELEFIIS